MKPEHHLRNALTMADLDLGWSSAFSVCVRTRIFTNAMEQNYESAAAWAPSHSAMRTLETDS